MEDSKLSEYKERIAVKLASFQQTLFGESSTAEEVVEELEFLTEDLEEITEDIKLEINNDVDPNDVDSDLLNDYKNIQGEM